MGTIRTENTNDILKYAKDNIASFEEGSVSSNEIRFFEYEGELTVIKHK